MILSSNTTLERILESGVQSSILKEDGSEDKNLTRNYR